MQEILDALIPALEAIIYSIGVGSILTLAFAAWKFLKLYMLSTQSDLVYDFVNAAEQSIIGEGEGASRYSWVMGEMESRFPDLDYDLIDAMIESAVHQMSNIESITIASIEDDDELGDGVEVAR